MREVRGNIWDYHSEGNTVCITTNGVVKKDGDCVMGAGIARQAKERFPDLPKDLGSKISTVAGNQCYFFNNYNLITFPTKHHWVQDSDIELIKYSCRWLTMFLDTNEYGIDKVYLPKPGCANGKLDWSYVKSEIEPILDDRVVIIDF